MILGSGTASYGHCFEEIDAAVHACVQNSPTPDRVVVFNDKHHFRAPPSSIIYNLENVPEQVRPELWKGHEIWDFSPRNISRYPASVPVTHVPIGWHPSMKRFERRPPSERDIDVVFCGWPNERRATVLDELRERRLHVEVPQAYGTERDRVLARAKLALDMRYYENGVFPALRSLHLVANGVPVIAETSPEMPPWAIEHVPYAMLAKRIEAILAHEKELNSLAEEAERVLRKNPLQLPEAGTRRS